MKEERLCFIAFHLCSSNVDLRRPISAPSGVLTAFCSCLLLDLIMGCKNQDFRAMWIIKRFNNGNDVQVVRHLNDFCKLSFPFKGNYALPCGGPCVWGSACFSAQALWKAPSVCSSAELCCASAGREEGSSRCLLSAGCAVTCARVIRGSRTPVFSPGTNQEASSWLLV